jgi:nitrogen regulatory protein PII
MKLLIYVLSATEKLPSLLHRFNDKGIAGATILDASGMGRELVEHDEFAIFGSMRAIIDPEHRHTKMLLLVIEDHQTVEIETIIESVVGSLNQPDNGILFTMPLDYVKGFKKPLPSVK